VSHSQWRLPYAQPQPEPDTRVRITVRTRAPRSTTRRVATQRPRRPDPLAHAVRLLGSQNTTLLMPPGLLLRRVPAQRATSAQRQPPLWNSSWWHSISVAPHRSNAASALRRPLLGVGGPRWVLPPTKQSTALRTYPRRKAKKSKQKQETCACTRPPLQLERPGVHHPLCHFCFSLQVIALTSIDAKHC